MYLSWIKKKSSKASKPESINPETINFLQLEFPKLKFFKAKNKINEMPTHKITPKFEIKPTPKD